MTDAGGEAGGGAGGEAVGRILPLTDQGPLTLRFASRHPDALRIGNFVTFDLGDRRILCRVTDRRNLDAPPETFYASAELDPEELLRFTGAPEGLLGDHVVEATILGSKHGPTFRAPRDPPPVGGAVHLAEDAYLEHCINRVPYADAAGRRVPGGLHVGHVLDRGERVRVVLDADSILSTHMAVLAATGQGKSYTTGVVLEELLRSHQRHPVLVFDFHAEYPAMQDAATVLADPDADYRPTVDVRTEATIRIPFGELELDDVLGLLPGLTDNMVGVVAAAYKTWQAKGVRTRQDLLDRIDALEEHSRFHEGSVHAVHRRFVSHILGKPYLKDGQGEDLRRLIRPGCMTVLNLSNLGDREQEGLASVLMSMVLKARRLTKTGQLDGRGLFDLPYPVLLVVEEAHRIAPPGNEKRSTRTLGTILSEGRKFGVGAVIVTQRPGKVESDILSQCLTQVISRITNPVDQQNIRQSAESATSDLMELLPALGRGEAVVFGHGLATPAVTAIRPRVTSVGGDHGSPTRDALAAFRTAQDTVEVREDVVPATRRRERI